ncbi:diguanylate cyclase (GGDEF)-like protein [Pseudoduganella flava]|uniref:diguanylate cyclase n=2 Tax=Pseudoduganella flava TaxID=871742 RepID=A0A562PKB6_9BURK|nr:diguanylate cyclase [Pseudoduganella flava]TWI44879.1 diguanylate cyclase (GGDEF)-like protein [Pseudoduganella flava]
MAQCDESGAAALEDVTLGSTSHQQAAPPIPPLHWRRAWTHPVIRPVILAAALASAIVVGFSSWFVAHGRQTEIGQAEVASSNVARMVGVQVEAAMQLAGMALADIAERVAQDGDDAAAQARLTAHLGELAGTFPDLHGLFVYRADGAWFATSLGRHMKGNNADREYFQYHQAHRGTAVHFGKPVKSRSTGLWVMPLSRGIYSGDGRFLGVAVVTLRINFFERIYDELNIGDQGTVLLMLSDGTVVYRRPFDEKLIGTDLSRGNIYNELRTRSVGSAFLVAKVDGLVRLYSFRRLEQVPILVAVGRTKDDILGNWRRSSTLIGAAALLICAIFAAFAAKLIRQLLIREELDRQLRVRAGELEQHNIGLHALAHTDQLTQLANRRRFDELLAQELRRAERGGTTVSLLLMDLDFFKQFNDQYGHVAGDDCLRRTASVLAAEIVRSGDLAARYGGEEFAVIMPNTGPAGAIAVAERIRLSLAALRIPHQHSATGVVTASFGVATAGPARTGAYAPADLIEQADRQLYAAKNNGRNKVSAAGHLRVAH